jgi:hypothetical protein
VIPGREVYSTDAGERTRALASMREPSPLAEPHATVPMRGVRLRFSSAHGEGCLACHDGIRRDSESWRERLLRDKFLGVYSY